MSVIRISDKEIDRLYSESEEMRKIQKFFYEIYRETGSNFYGYVDKFKAWLKENWFYVKDRTKIPVDKNRRLISIFASRINFKWAPELRFIKELDKFLADKLTNQEVKKGDVIEIEVYEHSFNLEITDMFGKTCDEEPINVDESVQLKVNERTMVLFDEPKIEDEVLLKKFKEFLNLSSHVRLDMLKNVLELPTKQFVDKIVEWKNQFYLEIKDDYIYFTKEDPSELINKLEEKFATWETSEKKTEGMTYKITNRELKSTTSSANQQLKDNLLQIMERLESDVTPQKEVIPEEKFFHYDLSTQKIIEEEEVEILEILEDPELSGLKNYDLNDYYEFLTTVFNRLLEFPGDFFFSLLQKHGLFNKLNNALKSEEFNDRVQAFRLYNKLLLMDNIRDEVKKELYNNYKELATLYEFRKDAKITDLYIQMKGGRSYKIKSDLEFSFEEGIIKDITIKNSSERRIINYNLLGELESLQTLTIRDDRLKSIPISFKKLKDLRTLNISGVSFKIAPDFTGLDSLENLSLDCMNLVDFPVTISKLNKLNRFTLNTSAFDDYISQIRDKTPHKSRLSGIPESLGKLNSLTTITLKCDLKVIPAFIQHFINLQNLHLASNEIIEVPKWIGKLTNLELIKLEKNQIRYLPESFGNLKKIRELNLQSNKLQNLPESFGDLTSLRILNLTNNEITHLPDSFANLTILERLQLINNRISKLPKDFGNLLNLNTLHLSKNQLKELPKSLGELALLEHLYLNNNNLTNIPFTIGNLNSLKILNLYNNQLSDLPKEFGDLKSLEILRLGNNKLAKMERFNRLTNLNELDIRNNPYSEIKGLEKLEKLSRLYLRNTKIPEKLIAELGGLRNEGYAYHPRKFVEYCQERKNSPKDNDPKENFKYSTLENLLKERLKRYDIEDDVYYELIKPENISKSFTQILNLLELEESGSERRFFLNSLLDFFKKTPLLTEKYTEIIKFIINYSDYGKEELILKLLEVSSKNDLKTYIFDLFKILEQLEELMYKVRTYCNIINTIKNSNLFDIHYDIIESQFLDLMHPIFNPESSIGEFYTLIKTFKDTKLFEKQYNLIEEKFQSFLSQHFKKELALHDPDLSRLGHNYNYILAMIRTFKGTLLLKSYFKNIKGIIDSYVTSKNRNQILMNELEKSIT